MKNRGFTLLELLICVTVIIILSAVSFFGYNGKRDTLALNREASSLIANMESMREKAMASQYYNGVLSKGGYGLYFQEAHPNYYTIFADCDGLGFDDAANSCNNKSETINTVMLDNRIKLSDFSSPQITVYYKFPFPNAVIEDVNNIATTSASINVELKNDPGKYKTIKFNSAGLIYAE